MEHIEEDINPTEEFIDLIKGPDDNSKFIESVLKGAFENKDSVSLEVLHGWEDYPKHQIQSLEELIESYPEAHRRAANQFIERHSIMPSQILGPGLKNLELEARIARLSFYGPYMFNGEEHLTVAQRTSCTDNFKEGVDGLRLLWDLEEDTRGEEGCFYQSKITVYDKSLEEDEVYRYELKVSFKEASVKLWNQDTEKVYFMYRIDDQGNLMERVDTGYKLFQQPENICLEQKTEIEVVEDIDRMTNIEDFVNALKKKAEAGNLK